MTLDEIEKAIAERAEAGGVTVDERIKFSELLTEAGDRVEGLFEVLRDVPDFIPEPEGDIDPKVAFVEAQLSEIITVDFSKLRTMDGIEINGQADVAQLAPGFGLILAGHVTASVEGMKNPFDGEFSASVELMRAEGGWDKGDYFKVSVGDNVILDVRDEIPTGGIHKIDFKSVAGEQLDFLIECSFNNSGGGSGGPAELVIIKSVSINKA